MRKRPLQLARKTTRRTWYSATKRLQPRVHPRSRAETVPEPTGGEAAERGGEAALLGDHWSRDVLRTSQPLRHPLRSQTACEGHVQARERSHGGGQARASLLGRVHRLLPSPTSRAASGLLTSRMLTEATTPTITGLRHHTS